LTTVGRRTSSVEIEEAEVVGRVEEMAQFGLHPEGGLYRAVYTAEWQKAVATYSAWLEAEGLEVRQDAVGNVFGVLRGTEPGSSIVTGSHIDTAIQGGPLDGTLGVIAAYLALRTLKRTYGQPRRTLEAVAVCDEEASRFHSNFWGSRAMTGLIRPGEAESIFDADGVSLADAMRSCGLDPSAVEQARRDDIDTFIELHIEQGPVLEKEGVPVAAVTAITAIEQLEFRIHGRADHAGGFPMDLRRDPMPAVAEMILSATRTALDLGKPAVLTVGRISARPGSPNIVAADVTFTIDARYPDQAVHEKLVASVSESFGSIAARLGLEMAQKRLLYQPATPCTPDVVEVIKRAAADNGYPCREMVSGAGHDTQVLARAGVKRAMIFVPSRDGRSHSPDEWTPVPDMVKGIAVLTETLRRLAY
jgi:allantoate deiminase